MTADVVCLIAPTASGKTALAYELYDTGQYYLISVDSALIYKDMNIGTAKPTPAELVRYPHALVDIIDPTQQYSVAQFIHDVQTHIHLAHDQGKTPLLVGGTMMYYMALLQGIADIPATLPAVREQVTTMISEQGIAAVHAYLQQIDPIVASRLRPSDTQRIGRAVEVFIQTGKPLSVWQAQGNVALTQHTHQHWQVVTVLPERAWLHARIAQRLDSMWQQGFVEEVIALQQKYPLHADLPSMRCVGYRQVWQYLQTIHTLTATHFDPDLTHNHLARQHALQNAWQNLQNQSLFATRQLAKRQYTWLRKLMALPNLPKNIHLNSVTTMAEASKHILRT